MRRGGPRRPFVSCPPPTAETATLEMTPKVSSVRLEIKSCFCASGAVSDSSMSCFSCPPPHSHRTGRSSEAVTSVIRDDNSRFRRRLTPSTWSIIHVPRIPSRVLCDSGRSSRAVPSSLTFDTFSRQRGTPTSGRGPERHSWNLPLNSRGDRRHLCG